MSLVSLPALLIGLIVGFYWGRVVKLVRKAARSGNGAHFVPPETLGRVIRIVWYPTVAAWIVVPLVVAFWPAPPAPPAALRPMFAEPVVHWLAVAAAAAALGFTMVCWRRMGRDWRMGIDPAERNNLIVTGPYAYVRHPIYALQQALAVASFVAVPVPVMAVVLVVELVFLNWEALREERHLTSAHGDVYRDYMRRAGRFLPKLSRP